MPLFGGHRKQYEQNQFIMKHNFGELVKRIQENKDEISDYARSTALAIEYLNKQVVKQESLIKGIKKLYTTSESGVTRWKGEGGRKRRKKRTRRRRKKRTRRRRKSRKKRRG